jgi:hypothetical protein
VDGSVSASGAGSTWSTAFKTLNEALDTANANTGLYEIYVAQGTYFPTGDNTGTNRDSSFVIARGGIKLLGGFPTGGGSRDLANNPVILSGELGATGGSDNSRQVMQIVGISSTDSIIVDGIEISGGFADGTGTQNMGAGLFCAYNSCNILFSNCQFTGNEAPGGQGGGVYFAQSGSTLSTYFYGCNFSGNTADLGAGLFQDGIVSVSNCSFLSNNANNGAGLYSNVYGGSIISGSTFSGNTASYYGGAMYLNYAKSSYWIGSCLFSGNTASIGGGAICDSTASPSIENCTFAANASASGNAILNFAATTPVASNPVITNSIIWEGTSNAIVDDAGTTTVTYSIVEGGHAGTGNSASNPVFVNAVNASFAPTTAGDFRLLSSCSPAVGAGLNNGTYTDTVDADGNARLFGTTVDFGAFEFQSVTPLTIPAIAMTSANGDSICVGTSNTFTATSNDGGTNPVITWTVNGSTVATGATFTSAALANGDTVIVSMVSNQFCTSTVPVEDTIIMNVLAPVVPTVAISASAGNQICAGTLDTFSLVVTDGGSAPTFTWMVNSAVVSTDSSFATTALAQGDTVSVVMSSNFLCLSQATAVDTVFMTVYALPAAPAVTTNITYCERSLASALTATGSTGATLNWYTVAAGGTASTTAPVPSTATADTLNYWVAEENANGCEGPRSLITVFVLPIPAKPVASATNPVCVGDTLFLTATTTATNPSFSWTGPGFSSTLQNPFIANATAAVAGKYWLSVTQDGCASDADTVLVGVSCLDSVWAGDANFDKLVDNRDALAIALNMGATGTARANASNIWQAQMSRDWTAMLIGNANVNAKHADCDGDGAVTYVDTLAIVQNYGSAHPKQFHVPANKTTGAPDLTFDHSGIKMEAGQTVTVPIILGSAGVPMFNVAGIAAHIMIDGVTPAAGTQISYGSSWLGTSSNTLRFAKTINDAQIDWAYARTDKQNITGGGAIALLTFTIPAGSEGQLMRLYFDDVMIVDSNGTEIIDYIALDDTFTVAAPQSTSVRVTVSQNFGVKLLPNPSVGACNALVTLPVSGTYNLEIRDLSGKLIWQTSGEGKAGQQSIALPVEKVNSGVYLINLQQAGQRAAIARWMRG